jgi:hypothetical protein
MNVVPMFSMYYLCNILHIVIDQYKGTLLEIWIQFWIVLLCALSQLFLSYYKKKNVLAALFDCLMLIVFSLNLFLCTDLARDLQIPQPKFWWAVITSIFVLFVIIMLATLVNMKAEAILLQQQPLPPTPIVNQPAITKPENKPTKPKQRESDPKSMDSPPTTLIDTIDQDSKSKNVFAEPDTEDDDENK